MKTSNLFSLDFRDLLKGLIMAVAGGAIAVISAAINAGNFAINFTALWHGALIAGVAYLGVSPNNPVAK